MRPRQRSGVQEKFANPYVAADRGFIDDVIEPRHASPIIAGLEMTNQGATRIPQSTGTSPL